MYTGTLTPRPSMICRKLNYTGTIEPETDQDVVLHQTPNIKFIYDVENGKIEVTLNQSQLIESVHELRAWMRDNRIPINFEGSNMFYIDVKSLNINDIPILESEGFLKKETENENCINFIWEMNEQINL